MSIQKINSAQNFNGIRKVVKNIPLKDALAMQSAVEKNELSSLVVRQPRLITKITRFFNGQKDVGSITHFNDGTFIGTRDYSDGTNVFVSTSKIYTKKFGETLFSKATVNGKNILTPTIPYTPFSKSGQPQFPTLKEIKAYNKPENILNLVKEGKLKIVRANEV